MRIKIAFLQKNYSCLRGFNIMLTPIEPDNLV